MSCLHMDNYDNYELINLTLKAWKTKEFSVLSNVALSDNLFDVKCIMNKMYYPYYYYG